MKSSVAVASALVALLAPAPAGAKMPDPAKPGPFQVSQLVYSAGTLPIKYGNATVPVVQPLRGRLHVPASGSGPFPVVVFQHGFHSSCQMGDVDGDTPFPCDLGDSAPLSGVTYSREERSYAGFDYIGRTLASHGYVVMSVDVNRINDWTGGPSDDGDRARQIVIGESLDLLAAWNAGSGPSPVDGTLIGRLDLGRIGLVGHSRGGEAVTSYLAYDRVRTDGPSHGIDAVMAIAPTDHRRPTPVGAAFATILPYCDGDVSNLQGAYTWERSKAANSASGFPHIQWSVNSANHNFFNTEWESDDSVIYDAIPHCGPTGSPERLDAHEQRSVGLALTAGFLRRYVGGETAFEPLVTGGQLPRSVCPDPSLVGPNCHNVVMGSFVAPAPSRRVVIDAGDDALVPRGFLTLVGCTPTRAGNGCGSSPNRSATQQLTLAWNRPAKLRVDIPAAEADVSEFTTVHLRAATNFGDELNAGRAEQDFAVRLTDRTGATATALVAHRSAALEASMSESSREVVLNDIRIPLSSFRGIRLTDLRSMTLEFGSKVKTGSVQLTDVAFQK